MSSLSGFLKIQIFLHQDLIQLSQVEAQSFMDKDACKAFNSGHLGAAIHFTGEGKGKWRGKYCEEYMESRFSSDLIQKQIDSELWENGRSRVEGGSKAKRRELKNRITSDFLDSTVALDEASPTGKILYSSFSNFCLGIIVESAAETLAKQDRRWNRGENEEEKQAVAKVSFVAL
ncbi:unnamed protein product [Vicia faba]|uniref:Uncharacterized protein n=1 Tax=Vicia faba TaxID=3906 RepID=A0AAV1B067_VICFA|nr:unnamed protein product [Vicia faba]